MLHKVVTIPASGRCFSEQPIDSRKKRRVAGYARVSTDNPEQLTSYESQVKYYTSYINGRSDWEFAGMYTDEGISATNTKHRSGFKKMVSDALAGKIDLIVTKSVSRFARNTVDSLTTVRKLKEKGIEIYFEKENIWTLDSKGELLITIMSSLAQEESRSISENVKWGKRKRFAEGKGSLAYSHFLGYKRGPNGAMVINRKEAEVVKMIYRLYLTGRSFCAIADELMKREIPAPAGGAKWHPSTIQSILKNEKYKGDSLLQKKFVVDFLSKRMKKNEGEIPQYYVENDHEAIISPEVFDLVQAEMKKRHSCRRGRYSGVNLFSSKIRCGDCGSWFGSKVWHSNDKYRKVIFQCNEKFKNGCHTPTISEDEIKDLFVLAAGKLLDNKEKIISNIKVLLDCVDDLSEKIRQAETVVEQKLEEIQRYVAYNSQVALDQAEYQKNYEALVGKYEEAKGEYDKLQEVAAKKSNRRQELIKFIATLEQADQVISFEPGLWTLLVDHVTVYRKDDVRFTFKDGTKIKVGE